VYRLFESRYLIHPNPLKLTSGTVLIATQKQTQITRLVVKIDQGYAGPNQQIISDLTLLVRLDHPNILAADAVFYDDRAIFVLSDIFNGLRLVEYTEIAERQDERVVKRLAIQMIRGVGYAHAQNCLLKNISILNMIFFAGHSEVNLMLKLVTLSKRERGPAGDFNPIESSIMYTAPEALFGHLTEKSDIWSCGVILYFLLTNSVPFLGDTPNDLKDSVLSGVRFSRKRWSRINPLAKSLISAMLTKDPLGRPTAAECIAHPWL
jgi:serine/threonine protein kinase